VRRTGVVVIAYFDEVVAGALPACARVLQAELGEGELYVVTSGHLYGPATLDAPSLRTRRIAG